MKVAEVVVRLGEMRAQDEGALIGADRGLGLADGLLAAADIEQDGWGIGLERESALVMGDGFGMPAELAAGVSETRSGGGELRPGRECRLVMRHRALELSEALQREAKGLMGVGIICVGRERKLKVPDCACRISEVGECAAQQDPGLDQRVVERHGALEMDARGRQVAQASEGLAEHQMKFRGVAGLARCLIEQGARFVDVAQLQPHHGEAAQGAEMVRLERQHFSVGLFGDPQSTFIDRRRRRRDGTGRGVDTPRT